MTLFNLPIMAGAALVMKLVAARGGDAVAMTGASGFSIRDESGRYVTTMNNTNFSILSVPLVGEPRPRRILARLQVRLGEDGEGQAVLDAWPMAGPSDFRKGTAYTIRSPANAAYLGDDSLFWTERAGRKTAYSLSDGARLFDADLPLLQFVFEPELRRMAAVAVAEDEFTARGVAVISYAAPGRVLRRVVLVADDTFRANTLRATITATRLVSFTDDALGGRVIDLPLAAGSVRIPVTPQDMDLSRAKLPAGLRLVPIQPWGGS
ncbi:hypothetical protein [Paramagnetospirillum marisnigri]|uniref:hypothetical protein n=1 Tax=Paramagnetospirillum marisnigri TaxID=1285242 RepID=UPI001FDECEFE|nr:hypothetical protein [Paramagnetospirillum marisnigri]